MHVKDGMLASTKAGQFRLGSTPPGRVGSAFVGFCKPINEIPVITGIEFPLDLALRLNRRSLKISRRGGNLDSKAGGQARAPKVPSIAIRGSAATRSRSARPAKEPAEKPHACTKLNGVMGTFEVWGWTITGHLLVGASPASDLVKGSWCVGFKWGEHRKKANWGLATPRHNRKINVMQDDHNGCGRRWYEGATWEANRAR